MPPDEVIAELWRIKDDLAAECNGDVHALAESLRRDEMDLPRARLVPGGSGE